MSLADQSQQWFPTSVQVTVHQARSLRVKGKNGTNDAYAIIQVAKDKFSTSVAEKSVAPVWKEEASFDLPLFHPGNAERCTLYIIVMHRAQVGLDKFLGQAVVNLLDLYDNKSRKKTDWFKLVDKTGKEDKARGEVLLDIQFMRNNMSASMFDLSMQDKPRSRISKLKDKVRGKKKDGFSDSASAIVPSSVGQVLTDSETEADAQSLNQSPGTKKKSKLKSLFAPKSNLQRNISQSMSTLGTLPEKNSSLSSSRSSGLNVESPEGKKKFKFLGHKRTGSSDSKVSQGPFSLLGRSKQSNSDQNNLCINGSHVYAEEGGSRTGSTLSLNSSGPGSVEDVHRHSSEVPSIHVESESAILEQQRHREEEERRQAEERRLAEARRQQEEEKYRAEAKRMQEEEERRLQEEQEWKRRYLEEEARRKKQKEEEEERRRQEEERRIQEAENQRLEEERRRAEEQKRQEEASMSDRLSSLFGMIRKKEEKKEEAPPPAAKEEPAAHSDSRDAEQPASHHSTNPFEDVPLSSEPPAAPAEQQKTPSAMVFLNRTAKVRPRLSESLESELADCQTPSPSPATPGESTLSSVPSESPDTFSSLHTSLAPPSLGQSGSPRGSTEDLSPEGSSPTMSDKKRRALQPPSHILQDTGNPFHVREISNPAYTEADGSQQGPKMSLPLPDYETLFPQRRHGVQGQTRWDHIVAEVTQKHRVTPEFMGPEVSVDGPEEEAPTLRSSLSQESPAARSQDTRSQDTRPQDTRPQDTRPQDTRPQDTRPQDTRSLDARPLSTKKFSAPPPPKSAAPPYRSATDSGQRQSQSSVPQAPTRPSPSPVPGPAITEAPSRESLSVRSRDGAGGKAFRSPSPALSDQTDWDSEIPDDQSEAQATVKKPAPTAKPRQRVSGKDQVQREDSPVTNKYPDGTRETSSRSAVSSKDKEVRQDNFEEFDPFPSSDLLSRDPWAQGKQKQEASDDFFSSKQRKIEDRGMTPQDIDDMFSDVQLVDPFASFNGRDSGKPSEQRERDESKRVSPVFQRKNSGRRSQTPPSTAQWGKPSRSQPEPAFKEEPFRTSAGRGSSARDVQTETITPKAPSRLNGGTDPFGAEPFTAAVASASSKPLQLSALEEPETQAGALSGGKSLLRAWVSPSEVQPVSAQSSGGGVVASTPRRPHPVKPLSSVESQHPISSSPAVKEIKARDSSLGKIQVAEPAQSGPYTQLTQEELITLVVKQQTDLSHKDAKITELEEYIDNLLVRVIDENPAILQSLHAAKPV